MSIDMTDTSKDLERQADASRAELSETLETLKDKLTPGQIFDDMFGGSSANAGAFLKNLGTSMRDHPMPAVLIGAGLVMMLTGGDKSRSKHSDISTGDHSTSDTTSGMLDGARATAHDARDGVQAASRVVGDTLSGMGDKASQVASDLREGAAKGVGSISSGARSASENLGQFGRLVSDQPIIAASIGLALGAVLAAAIPATETENSLMGAASDAVKQQAGDMLGKQAGKVTEAAGAVAHDMLDEAQAQGLDADAALAGVSALADKVGAVADKTTSSIKREARKLSP